MAGTSPKVALVGGSIAGLTAGLLLRDLGCEVQIFERSRGSLDEFGAGIILHEESARYFVERTDLTLDDISIPSDRLRYLAADGTTLLALDSSYRFTAWNALYRGLLHELGEVPYHRGEALVGFDQDGAGVELRFAGGRVERCDLAVCADGALSTARMRMLGIGPRYTGYIGWRGILHEHELAAATWREFEASFTYALLPDGHAVAYPIPTLDPDAITVTGRRVNYTWYRNVEDGPAIDEVMTDRNGFRQPVSCHPHAVQQRLVDEMRAAAAEELPAEVAELITATREPFITATIEAEAPRLVFGRVCLLGDSGFTARPHAAAGAAKACASAWALADAMAATGLDVAEALRRWEPAQLSLGRNLVARARDMGCRLQFGGPWTPGDPELRFGLYGPGR